MDRNKRGGCVAESKRGLKCVLYCQWMYAVPETVECL